MAAKDARVVEVTCCIYKLCEEKPTSKWSFLTKIDGNHFQFFEKLRKECGVQKDAMNADDGTRTRNPSITNRVL